MGTATATRAHDEADEAADSPIVWFALLERGRLAHDFALAARAERELQRLGVKVKYQRPKGSRHA